MGLILTDEQKATLSVAFKTAAGHDAVVDGVPAWNVSDPAVLVLTPSADGLSAVIASGSIGLSQVSVIADADLGPGIASITGTLDVEVKPAQAVTVGINAGAPELK